MTEGAKCPFWGTPFYHLQNHGDFDTFKVWESRVVLLYGAKTCPGINRQGLNVLNPSSLEVEREWETAVLDT